MLDPDSDFYQQYFQQVRNDPHRRSKEVVEVQHRCTDRGDVAEISGWQLLRVVVSPAPAPALMLGASYFLSNQAPWILIGEARCLNLNGEQDVIFQTQGLLPACRPEAVVMHQRLVCVVYLRRPY